MCGHSPRAVVAWMVSWDMLCGGASCSPRCTRRAAALPGPGCPGRPGSRCAAVLEGQQVLPSPPGEMTTYLGARGTGEKARATLGECLLVPGTVCWAGAGGWMSTRMWAPAKLLLQGSCPWEDRYPSWSQSLVSLSGVTSSKPLYLQESVCRDWKMTLCPAGTSQVW